MSAIKLRIMELPPIGTNAYLLINEHSGEAALIDAPYGAKDECDRQMARFGTTLVGVWLTHGHWDHMLDAHAFNKAGIPVYAHKQDEFLINNPEVMASFSIPGLKFQPASIQGFLHHGQELEILGDTVKILHVPGHSPGSIAFQFNQARWIFSGDVVFAGSVGRTDFPGCSHEVLMESIRTNLLPLADDWTLFPGHGAKTTIGIERANNPFIRGLQP
jgi:hydroxyacylglutathione hydrolase